MLHCFCSVKGNFDKDYFREKFDLNKLKCIEGSHFYNGSCYFISNKKYSGAMSSLLEDDLFLNVYKQSKKNRLLSSSIDALPTSSLISTMPYDASWKRASDLCANLNNESTLISLSTDNEFDYLIYLLTNLNFPALLHHGISDQNSPPDESSNKNFYSEEQKYFIGLTYNSKY
jgi:hypothetical protein